VTAAPFPPTRPRVEIVIDELVLRGVPSHQARAVSAALEARLATLAEGWVPADVIDRADASLRLSAVDTPAATPSALGEHVAGSVWDAVIGDRR
jgi:hypothetical protein